jgi:hypothetical protein
MTDLESSIYQDGESRKNPTRIFPLIIGTKVQADDGDIGEIIRIDIKEMKCPYSIKWKKANRVSGGYTEDEIFRRFTVVIEKLDDEDELDESPLNIIIVEKQE